LGARENRARTPRLAFETALVRKPGASISRGYRDPRTMIREARRELARPVKRGARGGDARFAGPSVALHRRRAKAGEWPASALAFDPARGIVAPMAYAFLSDPWFDKVEELVAQAGDLQVPAAMKDVEVNVTIKTPSGEVPLYMKEGIFRRGHQSGVQTSLTLGDAVARKIFVEGDVGAGVQAFLTGEIQVEGDLAKVVAMQTVEPSAPQQALTRRVAAITAP
jgi:putative sterol carrier protein